MSNAAGKHMHGKHFDHPWYEKRRDKGILTKATRNAMFAEWKKLSPGVDFEGTEREARIWWANERLAAAHRRDAEGADLKSWSELKEGEARFLLKKMREESGDGPAYRAQLIARMAQELFGAAWDRLLADRLRARFQKYRAEDLTPAEAHAEMEELLSRIARRDGIGIEEARARFNGAREGVANRL